MFVFHRNKTEGTLDKSSPEVLVYMDGFPAKSRLRHGIFIASGVLF